MPAAITRPDEADVAAAGRPFPMRDPLASITHERIVMLLHDRRGWWLDAAQTYLDQAEAGTLDAITDARRALAASREYAPDLID